VIGTLDNGGSFVLLFGMRSGGGGGTTGFSFLSTLDSFVSALGSILFNLANSASCH